VRNTRYEAYLGNRISKEEAKKRISRVVAEEFSEVERCVLIAYYLQEMNITDIALERGVHKSSVCRALHRAEKKLKRFLKY
jgi:RNA polymerase sigma factor (sigma-70 family)